MKTTRQLTAIIERENGAYVALCPELDIASQGESIESAKSNLIEALELFFESADQSEVDRRLHSEIFITRVARELDLTETALRTWVDRARAERTGGKTGLTSAELVGTWPDRATSFMRRGRGPIQDDSDRRRSGSLENSSGRIFSATPILPAPKGCPIISWGAGLRRTADAAETVVL